MNLAWHIYRRLAQAFPHEFKVAYGTDVIQLGEDVVQEVAKRHGAAGLIRLIADIAIRLPLEYLSEMRRDLRYAVRGLIKSPGFALVGIISMGLGMGLTTNVYSSRLPVLLGDLAGATNAKRLVIPEKPFSYYYIEQYRGQKNVFTGVAAFQIGIPFNVAFQGNLKAKPERIFGQLVSADYFSVLGMKPQRGRMLNPDLDRAGDAAVVVISDRFWRNRLNSSPDAVGQMLQLNGQLATIVGIAPKDFNGAFSVNPAELFVPVTVPASLAPELGNDVLHQRNAREFLAMMCLAPGVTIDSAEAALDAITRRLDEQDASVARPNDKSRRVALWPAGTRVPLPRELKPVVVGFFFVLMGLIMTIACMNLANLLLARGANRRKELAIRLAVGAGRMRIIRQMMTEGILLSLLGASLGFPIAFALAVLSSKFRPPTAIPVETQLRPDWHAALFVVALAIVCGIGFSLAPALRATKTDLTPALKEGGALQLLGYGRFGLRNLLMVGEVAGSIMLLLITGFLVIGFNSASAIRTKFDPRTMVLVSVDPGREGYTPEKAQAFFEKLPAALSDASAVRRIALTAQMPFSIDSGDPTQWTAEDSRGASRVQVSAVEETVGAGYFAALSEPMLAGHEFTELDQRSKADESKELPAVLNESAARGFFGNENAIGQRIRSEKQSYEVVGVVHDMSVGITDSPSVIYIPLTPRDFANPPAGGVTIMARSDPGADALSSIRREIASIDPNLTLFNVHTLSEYLALNRAAQRFSINTYAGMGVFGLVLAAIGLAGVTAYAVAQRRKEIGIRMALGARTGQVLRLVLREGAALISIGTVLGFLGAIAIARLLSTLMHFLVEALRVGTNDPLLLAGAPLLLAVVALLACYVPARKAAQIDPLKALREE